MLDNLWSIYEPTPHSQTLRFQGVNCTFRGGGGRQMDGGGGSASSSGKQGKKGLRQPMEVASRKNRVVPNVLITVFSGPCFLFSQKIILVFAKI